MLARRRELLDRLARIVDEGRAIARREPSPLAAQGVVGGALEVVHARLIQSGEAELMELLNPLMGFIVLPYLGGAASRRELHQSLPELKARPARSQRAGPAEDLQMRITYRTVRVLSAIAASPGLSNAQLSVRAGIVDQGQMSKLLTRLARLDLVENDGRGFASGAANAWRLTRRGQELEAAIRRDEIAR